MSCELVFYLSFVYCTEELEYLWSIAPDEDFKEICNDSIVIEITYEGSVIYMTKNFRKKVIRNVDLKEIAKLLSTNCLLAVKVKFVAEEKVCFVRWDGYYCKLSIPTSTGREIMITSESNKVKFANKVCELVKREFTKSKYTGMF